jgi:hypothetical protein
MALFTLPIRVSFRWKLKLWSRRRAAEKEDEQERPSRGRGEIALSLSEVLTGN